ncbi:acyl-CoA dehydrogenase family protein [Brevibacillus sp. 179-C 1.1 NHS]|uniref:acyl-CoA dehydrogenase family protein n=1 Tax=Brevibacillus sp. 179-C 1.1 NHS TaxID=3235177 RepID=UPI0039A39B50
MNDITKMLIQSTTKIMKDVCTKEMVNDAEKGRWAAELWEVLAESGLLSIAVPEERNGNGGSYHDAFSVVRIAAKYSAPIPLAETLLANWLLADMGESVSEEPLTIAWKYSKPFAFRKSAEGWMVSGEAEGVPWARHAKRMLVIGTLGTEAVLTLLEPKKGTITLGQNMAGEARDTVTFSDICLEHCRLIPVSAERVQEWIWYSGALMRTVMMAGALERIMELTVAYSSERAQFGKLISQFQAVQHQLATLVGEATASDAAANCAVEAFEKNKLSKEIAMAKIRVNEAVGIAAPVAHQVHGAIGFTHEHILHQSTRRIWSWRDEFGSETEWGTRLAEELMRVDHNRLWSYITEKSS